MTEQPGDCVVIEQIGAVFGQQVQSIRRLSRGHSQIELRRPMLQFHSTQRQPRQFQRFRNCVLISESHLEKWGLAQVAFRL
ncbi:MAG: hypothetical protein HONDAALG_02414 [Gammaproteobacteria bacterium]|nr:hypothetical protein [Gammaproteobacteria bacterium]